MAKLAQLISEKESKTLENIKDKLTVNDNRIAAMLFRNLTRLCSKRSIAVLADGKRIKKVRAFIDNKFVMAKPIIKNNQVMLFYKKKYYSAADVFDAPEINHYKL